MSKNVKGNMPVVNLSYQVIKAAEEVEKFVGKKKKAMIPKDLFEKLGLYRCSVRLELCRRGLVVDRFFGAGGAMICKVA